MKLPKELKGKYVSRASFAKLQGEKNRLKRDIHILVMGNYEDAFEVEEKYRKEFQFLKDIEDGLREIAKQEWPRLKEKYNLKERL